MYDQDRMALLKQIMVVEFTAIDLTLFLDTHPNNKEALEDYNEATRCLKELKKQYVEKYGMLSSYGVDPSKCPWDWTEGPWPWEMEY